MHSVIVINPFNANPATDRFADGVVADVIDALETVTALMNDGMPVARTANGNIITNVPSYLDRTFTLVGNTVNGLTKGILINPKDMKWNMVASGSGGVTAHVLTLDVSAWNAVDLSPYVGQYASISITDLSMPEYNTKRTKNYSIEIIDGDDIDDLGAKLVTAVTDGGMVDTIAYDAGTDTFTITANGSTRIAVQGGDLLRDGVVATTVQPIKADVVTSELAEEEYRRSSQLGVNIHKMASDLSNVNLGVNPDANYTVFVIETVNNIGRDKGHQFTNTQILAIDEDCTNLVLEVESFLEYISGEDDTATWEA